MPATSSIAHAHMSAPRLDWHRDASRAGNEGTSNTDDGMTGSRAFSCGTHLVRASAGKKAHNHVHTKSSSFQSKNETKQTTTTEVRRRHLANNDRRGPAWRDKSHEAEEQTTETAAIAFNGHGRRDAPLCLGEGDSSSPGPPPIMRTNQLC